MGMLIQMVGQIGTGFAQAGAAKYNAQVDKENANVALQNVGIAGQAGSEQAAMSSERTRAQLGAIKANQGASGVSTNSGSAVDTQVSAEELGKLDALTVRSNATKEAYGYQTQAANFQNQAQLDTFEAKNNLTTGYLNATNTLLGSASTAASEFQKFQLAGGLG